MCIKSERIKFCTCPNDKNIDEFEQYWILYRFNTKKQQLYFGEAITPTFLRDMDFTKNCNLILKALNSSNTFDKPIELKNKDLLQLVVSSQNDDSLLPFIYYFEFNGKDWINVKEDPFEIMNNYSQFKKGDFEYY